MKIAEYFKKYSFDEIRQDYIHLFEENASKILTEEESTAWGRIYDRIKSMAENRAKDSGIYHACLVSRWEKASPRIDMNCHFCDSKNYMIGPLVDAVAKHPDELLAMELFIDKDVEISETEITAGLFWEITYDGMPKLG